LKITKVEKEQDSHFKVTGALTIKGITKPVTFPATIHVANDMVHAEATMTVDRTAYNIRYRSLKFFSAIGDKAIADEFTVTVNIIAKK
jgi:polyisoprenoid-binding protein YceI